MMNTIVMFLYKYIFGYLNMLSCVALAILAFAKRLDNMLCFKI